MQKEDFNSAKEDLGKLLTIAPRYTRAYLMRGEVNLKQNDTIQALKDFDTAIDMDRYDLTVGPRVPLSGFSNPSTRKPKTIWIRRYI